jgi:hypothetical protein
MDDLKSELKQCLVKYRDLDDKLREVNKIAHNLRENRKIVEFEMSDILKTPQMAGVGSLRLENDNSMIKIQRPGTYNRPWSLSKRDLQSYIDHYFETAGAAANRRDLFEFIVRMQKENSVETDFKFTRNIPENLENE